MEVTTKPVIKKEENSYRWILECKIHHLTLITFNYADIENHLTIHPSELKVSNVE